MAKRVHRRLKKHLAQQKALEDELTKLQNAEDPKERCKQVISFIQVKDESGNLKLDPISHDENPYHINDCFVGGTEILVDKDGSIAKIEDLRVGDRVICMVPTDKRPEKEEINHDISEYPKHLCEEAIVENIYSVLKHYITTITCTNQTTGEEISVELTQGHPMYVYGQGWKTVSGTYSKHHGYEFKVSQLQLGDNMCLRTGELAQISSIDTRYDPNGTKVYNIQVSNGHTYFANGFLSHNKCCVVL